MDNYRIFLYKPSGEFKGELIVNNLNVTMSIESFSSISFDIPENINLIPNTRLDDILDNYEVELWYGDISNNGVNADKVRFVIYKTPLSFDNNVRTYSYSGTSKESILENKTISNWPGILKADFYRKIIYNNINNKFEEITSSTTVQYTPVDNGAYNDRYINIPVSSVYANEFELEITQLKKGYTKIGGDYITVETPLIEYDTYNPTSPTLAFKLGAYYLVKSGDLITNIYIAVPSDTELDDIYASNVTYELNIYDNPSQVKYNVGYSQDGYVLNEHTYIEEDVYNSYFNDNIYQYSFLTYYAKDGLKLEEIVNDLLQYTPFSLDEIETSISEKYRSSIELNNITVYQALKTLAETFQCVPIYDTINMTVSFKPIELIGSYNGLLINYGTYLKSLNKDIDATKVVTRAKGVGANNLDLYEITPTGDGFWEDYQYYLDDYFILDTTGFTITKSNYSIDPFNSGISITYPSGDYNSRWMSSGLAINLAKWQYIRDYYHSILTGENNTTDNNHEDFYNLYQLRKDKIEESVNAETKFIEKEALSNSYLTLYKNYQTLVDNGDSSAVEFRDDFKSKYENALAAANYYYDYTFMPIKNALTALEDKFLTLSILLNKDNYLTEDMKNELFLFQKDGVFSDTKYDNSLDLLNGTIKFVNDNKIPAVTFDISIIDILAAQESEQDWDKIKIGDKIRLIFDDFNINILAQIKEISIDFQGNSLNLTISTIENYNKGTGNYIKKIIKRLSINNNNTLIFNKDLNLSGAKAGLISKNKFETGFNTEDTVIEAGVTTNTGEGAVTISEQGITTRPISINPYLEAYYYDSSIAENEVTIYGGTITAKSSAARIEISGTEGFKIQKKNGETYTDQVYIDIDGNAVFAGKLSAGVNGELSGWDIEADRIISKAENMILFSDPDNNGYNPYISIGQSTQGYDQTGSFIGIVGETGTGNGVAKLSLKSSTNSLLWDGTNLTVNGGGSFSGDISAATGTFGGSIKIGSGESVFKADSNGIYLGSETFANAEFSVTPAGALKSTSGNIGGWNINSTKLYSTGISLNSGSTPYLSVGQSTEGYENNGIYIGYNTTGKISAVNNTTSWLKWTGTALDIKGAITATSGYIGDWSIATTSGGAITSRNTLIDIENGYYSYWSINSPYTRVSVVDSNGDQVTGYPALIMDYRGYGFAFSNVSTVMAQVMDEHGLYGNSTTNPLTIEAGVTPLYLDSYSEVRSISPSGLRIYDTILSRDSILIKGNNSGSGSYTNTIAPATLSKSNNFYLPDTSGIALVMPYHTTGTTTDTVMSPTTHAKLRVYTGIYSTAINTDATVTITFQTTFTSTPSVVITAITTTGPTGGDNMEYAIESVSTSNFVVINDGGQITNGFSWIAIGW